MKKLNRRDYLIGMGAGAAGIVGAATVPSLGKNIRQVFTDQDSPRCAPGENRTPGIRVWQRPHPGPFPVVPENQIVKLIFHGLAGFSWCKNPQTQQYSCDVGFFDKPDNYHRHTLMIHAFSAPSCTPVNVPTKVRKLSLIVNDRAVFNEVYFYQPGTVSNRGDLSDSRDFRWIMDFESNYLYGVSLKKKRKVFKPTLSVPCGLFYTLHKTGSTFRMQPAVGPPINDVGNVADILAANVYVPANAAVELRVNDRPYPIQAPGEIHFNNHCSGGSHCAVPEPHNVQNKKRRNDFYMNHEAFEFDVAERELFLLHSGTPSPLQGTSCAIYTSLAEHRHSSRPDVVFMNDEAPCSGTGFGGGGGLPPYPQS